MGFPKWVYHISEPAREVANAEALAALGPGWEDTPAAFPVPAVTPVHSIGQGMYVGEFYLRFAERERAGQSVLTMIIRTPSGRERAIDLSEE